MPTVLNQIKSLEHLLTPVEKRITALIVSQPVMFTESTGKELAVLAKVSESALIRLSQRLGFSGLRDLKVCLAKDLYLMTSDTSSSVKAALSSAELKRQIFMNMRQALSRTEQLIRLDILEEVVVCIKHQKAVLIFSTGEALVAAMDLKLKLVLLGYKVELTQQLSLFKKLTDSYSIAFIITEPDKEEEVESALNMAEELTTILLTSSSHLKADYQLLTSIEENDIRTSVTTGRLVQVAVIDILFALLDTQKEIQHEY